MENRSAKTRVALRVTHEILHLLLNIIFYCIVVVVIYKACTTAYTFSYEVFGNVTVTDTDHAYERQVVIEDHESTMSIASKLQLYKLVENKYSFYLRAKLANENIKAGTYVISSDMNYDRILEVITNSAADESKKSSSTTSPSATKSSTMSQSDIK
ncbi:MAG: endolytic transglycosylase MltG [bacterium]|nr:endolytic transglycosylase MltG [bacterium]